MAKLIKQRVPNKRISTLQAPNIIIRFLSLFDNDIKTILPLLGDKTPVSASKAQSMLNMQFISKDEKKFLLTHMRVKFKIFCNLPANTSNVTINTLSGNLLTKYI